MGEGSMLPRDTLLYTLYIDHPHFGFGFRSANKECLSPPETPCFARRARRSASNVARNPQEINHDTRYHRPT